MKMVTIKPIKSKTENEEVVLQPEPVVEEVKATPKATPKTEKNTTNSKAKTVEKEEKQIFGSLKDNVQQKAVKKVESVDPNTLIPCRSLTSGTLVWENGFIWDNYNSVIEIPMKELTRMRGKSPKFLTQLYMIVEDEKAYKELRLEELYEDAVHIDNLSELFGLSLEDLEYALDILPKNLHDGIKSEALKAIKNGDLANINKIKLIETKLKLGDGLRLYLDV